ncbi:MAG: NifB/NifX family molybdenum-iron cluster-binding protein [Bacillota bacterium]
MVEIFAITASGQGIEAELDKKFGRCKYIIIYDPATEKVTSYENKFLQQSSGVGVKTAEFIADKGVEKVLTFKVGPKAAQVLDKAGIETITGLKGQVKDIIDKYI